ncbi:hypothetical protein DSM106972_097460 [Dulcicalothrix desertica PCC 7102]|uniref:Uncharacterized protein n=1 Tax=Dulcicalothrix desertica PCC 7102 TaxID=232991 RepID=A0A433UH34_9CYAN|nr:hypothetical protein [Dulcicalothrix desertica]RUS93114.1 hypothetical protein DSM106972_097460 [Dulcicalothrix desertica PCC 7102]TWH61190.1 hypothetical protein CAL7102_01045 [Dulcicalothrix desertica PCC 7102]
MSGKQVKDHISGVAGSNLNAVETLFGVDANALKNGRLSPEALAALKDLQADAAFWAKNGEKIRKQLEIVCAGTTEKTITLGMLAQAVNKFGKAIVGAKYNAALAQKQFGNFLQEKKLQAGAQFGQEEARHSTQMMFQQADNNLQAQIFRANVQMRYNQLKLKADSANHQLQERHTDLRASAAMQLGSNAPTLTQPNRVSMPGGVSSNVNVNSVDTPVNGLPMGTDAIADSATGRGLFGIFGAIGRGVSKVRSWLGI